MTPKPIDPKTLVRNWQRPVYHLAYRMLGNEADAADATQEIFAKVLAKLDRYDPEREFQPWIYRVAAREVRDLARKAAVRRDRERRAARKDRSMSETDPVLEEELRATVRTAVRQLPEPSRTALVLHFFSGLTQRQVAEVLRLPRTTIQSRLEKGLALLRGRLKRAGYPAAAVGLEPLLAETTPIAVPEALASTLTRMAASATAYEAPTWFLLGFLMKKTALIATGTVALLALTLGITVGRFVLAPGREAPAPASPRDTVAREDHERLEREHRRALARIADLEAASRRGASRGAPGEPAAPAVATSTASRGNEAATARNGTGIDWSGLRAIFAEGTDVLLALLERNRRGEATDFEAMSADERRILLDFMNAVTKLGLETHRVSDDPFFDQRILAEFAAAVLIDPLGLSDEQVASLERIASRALGTHGDPETLAALGPAERHRLRSEIITGFHESLASALGDEQRALYEQLRPVVGGLMAGPAHGLDIGVTDENDPSSVLLFFEEAYAVERDDPVLAPTLESLAARAMDEGRAILSRYGRMQEEPPPLTAQERSALEREFLELQVHLEHSLLPLLEESGLAALRERGIRLLRFHAGEESEYDRVVGGSIF